MQTIEEHCPKTFPGHRLYMLVYHDCAREGNIMLFPTRYNSYAFFHIEDRKNLYCKPMSAIRLQKQLRPMSCDYRLWYAIKHNLEFLALLQEDSRNTSSITRNLPGVSDTWQLWWGNMINRADLNDKITGEPVTKEREHGKSGHIPLSAIWWCGWGSDDSAFPSHGGWET